MYSLSQINKDSVQVEVEVRDNEVCTQYGAGHFHQFSGASFNYPGVCHYILAMDCRHGSFYIYTGTTHITYTTYTTCIMYTYYATIHFTTDYSVMPHGILYFNSWWRDPTNPVRFVKPTNPVQLVKPMGLWESLHCYSLREVCIIIHPTYKKSCNF